MVRDKRDIGPVILKFGVALALSLGGILFTFFRTKRINPSNSSSSPKSGGKKGELKDDEQTKPASGNSVPGFPWRYEGASVPKSITVSTKSDPSTNSNSDGDTDGVLLPEFAELVKEFSFSPKQSFSPCKDVETPRLDADSPEQYKIVGRDDHEEEIKNLKKIAKTLTERLRTLEIQLLECYGRKEQETTVKELQNRLKVQNLEVRHLGLKIESLKSENMKLKAKVADSAKDSETAAAAELEIKQLRKKLLLGADHSKGQILSLKERVSMLHDKKKTPVETESDVQLAPQKLNDLASEATELRKSNQTLEAEISTLSDILESIQILAVSALGNDEIEALKEESLQLRKQNEDLVEKVEQLQAARFSDTEELVYLRWVNACLRYELRNYQPAQGEITARDLSKALSPESEKKAKQLILEYANKEDQGDKGIHVLDFDSDPLSSQASYFTNSGELNDTSIDNSSGHKTDDSTKSKVFRKLMRLVRGKDHHHRRQSSSEMVHRTEQNPAKCSNSGKNSDAAVVDTGAIGLQSRSRTPSLDSSEECINFHSFYQGSGSNKGESRNYSSYRRRYSDVGSLDYISKRLADSSQEKGNNHGPENVHKSELAKYAEALRGSRPKASVHKRSASVSFF